MKKTIQLALILILFDLTAIFQWMLCLNVIWQKNIGDSDGTVRVRPKCVTLKKWRHVFRTATLISFIIKSICFCIYHYIIYDIIHIITGRVQWALNHTWKIPNYIPMLHFFYKLRQFLPRRFWVINLENGSMFEVDLPTSFDDKEMLLTLYTLTSLIIFSILFSVHLLRCWRGEFV